MALKVKLTLFFSFYILSLVSCGNFQPRAIQLTDETWWDVLEGEWMVEFMAPWCPACRAFQDTWDAFAKKWSRDLDVHIAVIDVTQNPGLSGRFLITALPTIYHVKNGSFRQYMGGRTENDLITFIDEKKWQSLEPVSKWTSPDSIQMSVVGLFFKLAMVLREFYNMMTEEYGIPEWGCFAIFAVFTIVAGLVLGLVFVCICDCISSSKDQPTPIPEGLMHPDKDKEGDLIDDTQSADGDAKVRRRRTDKGADDDTEDVTNNSTDEPEPEAKKAK